MNIPILFLIFNRPDLTRQVFSKIRQAQPGQLFIAADGPRPDRPEEVELCDETRKIVNKIDWDCDVHTLFREKNLGCKKAVSKAITWFFEHVEQGIILEDDCLPDPSFFRYCSELLEYYKNEEKIMVISGNNFLPNNWQIPNSYYFSIYNHIWGWATWRRAWHLYDNNLDKWPNLKVTPFLKNLHNSKLAVNYWTSIFDECRAGKIDSWGYPWTFSCWANKGLTILPSVNLVSNIGFDERGTHTKNSDDEASNIPSYSLQFPLKHPPRIIINEDADTYATWQHFLKNYFPPSRVFLFTKVFIKVNNLLKSIILAK